MSPLSALTPKKQVSLNDYTYLRSEIRAVISAGKARAQDAVERERVRTSWEIGKLINEHILLNRSRANYGDQVIKRLSGDLGVSARELHYMVEFARAYPIVPHAAQLSWSDYRDLLSVNEDKKRKSLTEQAAKHNWTREDLRREIGRLKARSPQAVRSALIEAPLTPIKGKLDTYRIVIAKAGPWLGKPVVDLGFSNYLSLDNLLSRRWPQESRKGRRGAATFKEGDIVRTVGAPLVGVRSATGQAQGPPLQILQGATPADLFTYRAYVLDVTDGDTLWVLIDLGFGFVTQQQLRLRGVDAPEISSRDGQAARRFVERELLSSRKQLSFPHALSGNPRMRFLSEPIGSKSRRPIKAFGDDKFLIITSTKSDKYDRYLADVFYKTKKGEEFLNNRLLKEKLAVKV